jgi:signal peptidase I
MKRIGSLISALVWLMVASSVIITAGGLLGRPLLLAAVPTGSMMPALAPSDMIVVLPTWLMPGPRPGDIVVFKTPQNST